MKINTLARALAVSATVLLGALGAGLSFTVQAQATSSVKPLPNDSLYQQFGAKEGLTKLMADFVERLYADPRTRPFFKDIEKTHLQAQLTDQLCEVSGGPCQLQGPSMKRVHDSLEIDKSSFNALVEVLQQSMDAQGIPFAAQNRMLAQLAPMNRDIISKD